MAENVEEKVFKIITQQLEIPADKLVLTASFADDLKADSLAIVELVLALEESFKLEIPDGMSYKHVITLGCIAGIGFTVALFVSTAAFNPNDPSIRDTLNAVKMGALLSFGAAIVSFIVAKFLGIRRTKSGKPKGD